MKNRRQHNRHHIVDTVPEDEMELFNEGARLHKQNKLSEAEQCYRAFLRSQPVHADCLHQLGALLIQKEGASQYQEALRFVKAAIQLAPANARYRRSLGVVHEAAEQWLQAADAYERAIEKRPNDVKAHMDLARVLKAADRNASAAEAYRAVIRLQPDHPTAHYKLASMLRQLGRHREAAVEYREQLRIDPNNTSSAFWLAAIEHDPSAAACPASLVAKMFDQYADHFDQHLTGKLQYKTPSTLMECIWQAAATSSSSSLNNAAAAAASSSTSAASSSSSSSSSSSRTWQRAVDLGCGTGLMGPLLRPHTGHLSGVDLSGGMVDKACERGCYDDLAVGELGQYLTAAKQEGVPPFDLLVAADVFVYIGDLMPVMQAAAAVAADRALFAFSTELLGTPSAAAAASSTANNTGVAPSPALSSQAAGPSSSTDDCGGKNGKQQQQQQYVLQTTGRYAHSAAYLRLTAAASGWQVLLLKEAVIRYNAGHPIWGNLCVLQRSVQQQ